LPLILRAKVRLSQARALPVGLPLEQPVVDAVCARHRLRAEKKGHVLARERAEALDTWIELSPRVRSSVLVSAASSSPAPSVP
jgi:hypothetical protein